MKEIKNWLCEHRKFIVLILVCAMVFYLIVFAWFYVDGPIRASDIDKRDWLSFLGSFLGFTGTVILGVAALVQNNRLNEVNKKLGTDQKKRDDDNYRAQYYSFLSRVKGLALQSEKEPRDLANLSKDYFVFTEKNFHVGPKGLAHGCLCHITLEIKGKIYPSRIRINNFCILYEADVGEYQPIYFSAVKKDLNADHEEEFYPVNSDENGNITLILYLFLDNSESYCDLLDKIAYAEKIRILLNIDIINAFGVVTSTEYKVILGKPPLDSNFKDSLLGEITGRNYYVLENYTDMKDVRKAED